MKQRFYLFRRASGIYFIQDSLSGGQKTTHTRNRREAEQILNAKLQSVQQPHLNIAIAKAHLAAIDPKFIERTWQLVMDDFVIRSGRESTRLRRERAMRSRPFALIRDKKIVETTADDLRSVLKEGGVFTNHFLRCLHNLAFGLGWLPWPIIPAKLWPQTSIRPKRGITEEEHEKIIQCETRVERKVFYELLWEIGASQSDAANLCADNIDWNTRTLSYRRMKTGEQAIIGIGSRLEALLKKLPSEGALFPTIAKIPERWRSAEFRRRCRLLNIEGVTLHSYRYAWAERARKVGMPERFAQEALGHNSNAVHRAYAKGAQVRVPSLESYEETIIQLPAYKVA